MKKLVRKLDDFQQRHRPTAFAYGVVKKYGQDRGSNLSALIAYYGFLSLFPLLLLFYTVSAYLLSGAEQAKLAKSVFSQFPVIGADLSKQTNHPLHGSPVALILGVATLAWGALGVSQILQQAMYEVWGVPRTSRPKFVSRVVRGLLLFALLGVGIVATTVLAGLGSVLDWGPFGSVLAAIPAAVVNVGVFLLMFKLLSPAGVTTGTLARGAVVAGIGWQILQTVGVNLVSHQLRHSSQVYGVFAVTLGLLSFLYLAGELTVYAAEINVVRERHLWPRSLLASAGDEPEVTSPPPVSAAPAPEPAPLPAPAPAGLTVRTRRY